MDERCEEALQDLQTYLDGECGRSLAAVIRDHLGDCPPCLDRADFERELRAVLADRCRDAAPSGLLDRVLDHLASTHTAGHRAAGGGDPPGA